MVSILLRGETGHQFHTAQSVAKGSKMTTWKIFQPRSRWFHASNLVATCHLDSKQTASKKVDVFKSPNSYKDSNEICDFSAFEEIPVASLQLVPLVTSIRSQHHNDSLTGGWTSLRGDDLKKRRGRKQGTNRTSIYIWSRSPVSYPPPPTPPQCDDPVHTTHCSNDYMAAALLLWRWVGRNRI